MIAIGPSAVNSLFIGTTPMKKVYVGDKLVFDGDAAWLKFSDTGTNHNSVWSPYTPTAFALAFTTNVQGLTAETESAWIPFPSIWQDGRLDFGTKQYTFHDISDNDERTADVYVKYDGEVIGTVSVRQSGRRFVGLLEGVEAEATVDNPMLITDGGTTYLGAWANFNYHHITLDGWYPETGDFDGWVKCFDDDYQEVAEGTQIGLYPSGWSGVLVVQVSFWDESGQCFQSSDWRIEIDLT